MNGKVDCVAGLFSGLWCIAVIQEQASPIYLRQHKSAQPSTANVVESIAPPISSHIPTACSCCVPGKGGARGGKAGFATLSAFPLVNCPMPKWSTPEGKNAYASSTPSGKENACRIQAPPPGGIRPQSHHETEESVSPVDMAPSEAHQTPLKYSDRKLPYRFLYKAPARSVPDKA